MTDRSSNSEAETRTSRWLRWLTMPLAGLGQIMFQNSPLTGAFFLTGIAVQSPVVAVGGALGAVTGTLTATGLGYKQAEIRDGLYGYNAALAGMALAALQQPGLVLFAVALFAAMLTVPLTHLMREKLPVPAYTAPFVVMTWLALFVCQQLQILPVGNTAAQANSKEVLNVAAAVIKGLSEVMFQANVLTGVLFLVGILFCSWKGMLWAIAGSFLGLLAGLSHHAPEGSLSLGLLGYNAALAAMALALYRPSVVLPVFGALLTVPLTEQFPQVGLATLTAPFVLASWIVIGLDRLDKTLGGERLDQLNENRLPEASQIPE